MKLIKHPGIPEAKTWAPYLKGKDLKNGVREVLKYIEDSNFAVECFPLSEKPKIAVRAPVGEIMAMAWFDLTKNDTRIGYNFYNIQEAYEDNLYKGLKKDDLGSDLVGDNINEKLSTGQIKLITNPNHVYTTGEYGLEERQKVSSYIEESSNIFSANDVILKENQDDYQQVLWMTCLAIPLHTSEIKLRGKLRQLCFSKTDYKKGIVNINDFTHTRFMNDMIDLIIASSENY